MTRYAPGDGATRARVIAFANQKGGVAKSTTAEAFAASLTARGYAVLMVDMDGTSHIVPEEGSFFQTENSYEAFVYFRNTGERTWRLVGWQEIVFKP